MNNFNDDLAIGQQYERQIDQRIEGRYYIQNATCIDQAKGIDRWFGQGGQWWPVEYKADTKAFSTGNVFIETVSVDVRDVQGWIYTSKASWLLYLITGSNRIYMADFAELRSQLPEWINRHRQVSVKNDGYNTIGLLVPIKEFKDKCFQVLSP